MTAPAILVTGAASGIGRAIVLGAARRRWHVCVADIDGEGAERTARDAAAGGAASASAAACDVADEHSVAAAFESLPGAAPLTGVVANAGIEQNAPLHEIKLESWQRTIDVNLTGVFLTCKHALRRMLASGTRGAIVCTASPSAFVGFAGGGNAAYAASKGGIVALVKSAAVDYAAAGIRVNALVPGATDTPHLSADPAGTPLTDIAAQQIPMRRMASACEIADAALWLLGDDASYVTGTALVCDGGLLARGSNTF